VRRHGVIDYAAKHWPGKQDSNARRVIARVEAGPQGNDTCFISPISPAPPSISTRPSTVHADRPRT
jgi:hypothetical protein